MEDTTVPTPEVQTPTPTQASPVGTTLTQSTQATEFWGASLPEDLRNDPTLGKYTSLEAAARGLTSAVKMIGKHPDSIIELPGATDEVATREVLHRLGLPKAPEDYRLAPVEGVDMNAELTTLFKDACYESGVLPSAMQKVFEKVGGSLNQFQVEQARQQEARDAANMSALETKYAGSLNDFLTRAEVVTNHFGLTEKLNEAGLGTDPGVLEVMAKLFPTLQEDPSGGRTNMGSTSAKTPEQYNSEANELQRQALMEPVRSRQIELANQALRLRQLANGR